MRVKIEDWTRGQFIRQPDPGLHRKEESNISVWTMWAIINVYFVSYSKYSTCMNILRNNSYLCVVLRRKCDNERYSTFYLYETSSIIMCTVIEILLCLIYHY